MLPVTHRRRFSILFAPAVLGPTARWGGLATGGRKFAFRVKPRFPKSLTNEFMLVDLVNNADQLAEAKDEVLKRVMERATSSDKAYKAHKQTRSRRGDNQNIAETKRSSLVKLKPAHCPKALANAAAHSTTRRNRASNRC
jgi:hypothetical protein